MMNLLCHLPIFHSLALNTIPIWDYSSITLSGFGYWLWGQFGVYSISATSSLSIRRLIPTGLPLSITLARVIEIFLAYLISILISLNFNRVFFTRLLLLSSTYPFLLCLPKQKFPGSAAVLIIMPDIGVSANQYEQYFSCCYLCAGVVPRSIRHFSSHCWDSSPCWCIVCLVTSTSSGWGWFNPTSLLGLVRRHLFHQKN